MFSKLEKIFIVSLVLVVVAISVFFVLFLLRISFEGTQNNQSHIVDQKLSNSNDQIVASEPEASISADLSILPHPDINPAAEDTLPQEVNNSTQVIKAVYVTGTSAGNPKYLDYLENLFKNTQINAVVVNIKGSEGYVSYKSGAISDIDALIKFFHDRNIYVIGRISVFQDPVYAQAKPELAIYDKEKSSGSNKVLWHDNNGLSWLDPASKDVWDYNISLAKDAFLHGFDEINFDYVRFPSDGKTESMGFPFWDGVLPMADKIKEFFQYVRTNLPGKISVDLFGQTTTNTNDMGIGQIIENAFENFDFVSPMVYPSHYVNGFLGFENPAEHPYEIVKYSMISALIREKVFLGKKLVAENKTTSEYALAKFRPWLQDFNMGAYYNADMVKLEIQATQEALGSDYYGFMLWNPGNIYTQGAIVK